MGMLFDKNKFVYYLLWVARSSLLIDCFDALSIVPSYSWCWAFAQRFLEWQTVQRLPAGKGITMSSWEHGLHISNRKDPKSKCKHMATGKIKQTLLPTLAWFYFRNCFLFRPAKAPLVSLEIPWGFVWAHAPRVHRERSCEESQEVCCELRGRHEYTRTNNIDIFLTTAW